MLDEQVPIVDDDADGRRPGRPHALVKRLHAFQREAAELIWRKLYRDDLPVVILADDVGLGKTYTALEVIRRATETGHTGALVLCPARLESMWRGFAGIRGERTTFDDPLTFSVVTHERIPHFWTKPRHRGVSAGSTSRRSTSWSSTRPTPSSTRTG